MSGTAGRVAKIAARRRILLAAWAALLVAGFAVVAILGAPVLTAAEELDAAFHPAVPVSQAEAEQAAATIVRLQYPSLAGVPATTALATDFGIRHWVVEYTDRSGSAPRGVRVSIVVDSGQVEVSAYP